MFATDTSARSPDRPNRRLEARRRGLARTRRTGLCHRAGPPRASAFPDDNRSLRCAPLAHWFHGRGIDRG